MNKLFRRKPLSSLIDDLSNIESKNKGMKRSLGVRDLTALGIAAIIGAGIFSTIGTAAVNGGPAVSLLFTFTAIACGFSALCYAQFASGIPISGSAYTYAYVSFGEIIAWIIGWDLIMEYAVGNIAVAISWSDYFTALLSGIGLHVPDYLSMDFLSAKRGFSEALNSMKSTSDFSQLSYHAKHAYLAWNNAPELFGVKIIADIPAFTIVVLISILVYRGINETKVTSNILVLLKLIILILVIGIGAFYIQPQNWSPFAPNGIGGVLKGVAGVFFAYIGFDAISTTAEECKNPQRDLPRSMIYALLITTILYVLISLVLTGIVHYSELGVGDPLAYAFEKINQSKLSGIIAISAVIAMAGVLLVFQVGQPRIWMSMSRDGLLPKKFSIIHPKYKTPKFSTIIAGVLVALPSLFMNLTEVTDLTSIGTLFAFVLVSGGVLIMDARKNETQFKPKFKVFYINSRYFLPLILIIVLLLVISFNKNGFNSFFEKESFSNWNVFKHKIPFILFVFVASIVSYLAIVKKYSLIPVLGLLTNLYLMSELGVTNWLRFLIWLAIGLVLYFLYGKRYSRLKG